MLALDDDTSEFHRLHARDPLIGPAVQRLRGMRTRRKATVTHAVIRGVCGQLIQASRALQIERAIIRACGEDPPSRVALAGLSPARIAACGLAGGRAATLTTARPDDRLSTGSAPTTARSSGSDASVVSGRGRSASSRCRGSAATTQASSTTSRS